MEGDVFQAVHLKREEEGQYSFCFDVRDEDGEIAAEVFVSPKEISTKAHKGGWDQAHTQLSHEGWLQEGMKYAHQALVKREGQAEVLLWEDDLPQ